MIALWISDAHLSDPAAPPYTSLMTLLQRSMGDLDSVVLLGDFFELWIGDNRILIDRHKPLLDLLRRFRQQGKSISFLKGNHDFILGKTWETDIGARIYDAEAVFDWDGFRFFASHGDHINKKDYAYRIMRKLLRTPLTERLVRRLGDQTMYNLSVRFASAAKGHPDYRKEQAQEALFYQYAKSKIDAHFHAVILGHTHIIQWQILSVNHMPRLYVNPGSWQEQNTYLWYDTGRFQLRKHRVPEAQILFDFICPVD
jgi:UDP-2,3-diacylglucosamine hydrolase